MRFISFILFLIFIFAASCSTTNTNGQKYTLPSGKQIVITGMNGMKFENGETALVFNYQTDIPIENHDELKKEVEEIWTIFQHDVEQANVTTGVIRATHIEDGGLFVKNGKGYGFLYRKNSDGKWYLDESKNDHPK